MKKGRRKWCAVSKPPVAPGCQSIPVDSSRSQIAGAINRCYCECSPRASWRVIVFSTIVVMFMALIDRIAYMAEHYRERFVNKPPLSESCHHEPSGPGQRINSRCEKLVLFPAVLHVLHDSHRVRGERGGQFGVVNAALPSDLLLRQRAFISFQTVFREP